MKNEGRYLLHRRFDRMGRLVGDGAMEILFQSHVMVIGLGGVGGWAAESIVRSGVGRLTLIDFDDICVTNSNRQIQALQNKVGLKKAEVLAERFRAINPSMTVEALVQFYNPQSAEDIFALEPDFILDCIDNISAKCHLLHEARRRKIPIVTSGGGAGRMDPLRIQCRDLSATSEDPMLQQIRKVLRQKYQFPREKEGDFGIPCVFSDEPLQRPLELFYDQGKGFRCVCPKAENDFHSCEKRNLILGSASFVTGSLGLAMAAQVVQSLIKTASKNKEAPLDGGEIAECCNEGESLCP